MGSLITFLPQVYLDAWKYVKSQLPDAQKPPSDALSELVGNWTNDEFEKFVKDLEDIVNGYVTRLSLPVIYSSGRASCKPRLGIQPGTEAGDRAEEIWARIVELEAAFWPLEEDVALLSV